MDAQTRRQAFILFGHKSKIFRNAVRGEPVGKINKVIVYEDNPQKQ